MNPRTLTPFALALGLAWTGSASAVVIGGIDFADVFDPPAELETTTITETLVTGNTQELIGYGQVNTVNNAGNYCAVDADCRLFFYFEDYMSTNFQDNVPPAADTVDFTGGNIYVYYDPNGQNYNFLAHSSLENIAYIQLLEEWVQFSGHPDGSGVTLSAQGTLTGANITFTGGGLLDVVLGAFGDVNVQNFLNGNSEADGAGGFADKTITTSGSSSVTNTNDVCTMQPGQFCIQGSADLRGLLAVPEPGSLALLGLALAGLGFTVGRGKKAA